MSLAARPPFSIVPLVVCAAFAAHAASLEIAGRRWEVPDHADLDGSVLTLRADGPGVPGGRRNATATTEVDLGPFLEAGGVEWRIRAKCVGIEKPEKPWFGFKAMLSFKDGTGAMKYPGPAGKTGDFGWYAYRHRASLANGADGPATFTIGLQEAKGEVSFDLSSLEFLPMGADLPPDNPDYCCVYTSFPSAPANFAAPGAPAAPSTTTAPGAPKPRFIAAAERHRPLRGFMLPSRGLHDEDFAKLASWGVTLVRYQMSRNWPFADTERDLADYDAWMKIKLDHLEERVIPFAAKYGIMVIVDLHMPPGGRSADHELNMLYEPEFADHFVETWRRIARRFKDSPAICAYDLVNEPHQTYHSVGGNDYLSLQIRAAKAIREIDPDMPVVVEPIHSASPEGFKSLAAVPMENVIYEVHVYQPFAFTHQGVGAGKPWDKAKWPDPDKGWDREFLRERLAPVRDFQLRHNARIYVGEFSAAAWAEGAGDWLRDAISLFDEYGWDWTYHAFDEWAGWSIEHEAISHGMGPENFRLSEDNPRRRALLDGLAGRITDEPPEAPAPAPATHRAAGLDWQLPGRFARIEGNRLIVDIPQETPPEERRAHCVATFDAAPMLADNHGILAQGCFSGTGISEPDHPWNGAKFMFHYREGATGMERWPGVHAPRGDFDGFPAELRLNEFNLGGIPKDGQVELILGLEGCTGHVEYDLSSLRLESEDMGFERVNEDWIVRYPPAGDDDAPPARPLRGCMLPGRATREDDIETLHRWGATLVRFQITRNWHKVDDNQDLDEYAAWIDRRLANLEDVLEWCAARDMKVCIDLHQPPGGKRGVDGRPYEMNMFHDERWADAFVDTWRTIATRVKGHPAIYGYDLVNEPHQRGPAAFSYWELQRRAAEAVREIDPDTAIVVESNLADRAWAFRYLSPLAMDNVIYECHMYEPSVYTHQGIFGPPPGDGGTPVPWPGRFRGQDWNRETIRRELEPVLEFQRRHKCRIYVGEFSAAAWAPGAENYLRDCIAIFNEYGWDWTYHAFREAPVWDVEKAALPDGSFVSDENTPRKRALLDGFAGD